MNANNIVSANEKPKLGIIAGYGLLPEIFVDEVKNVDFYIVGFKGYTNKRLHKYCKSFKLLSDWNLSEVINFFRNNDVNKTVLLGYLPHKILLKNLSFQDKKTEDFIRNLKTRKAMDIFYNLSTEFGKLNITIEPINKYLKKSFAEKGEINGLKLTQEEIEDINFGYDIAKQIADLDIGLTVVVKNKIVVAVEALEGTDNCILRAKKIAGKNCVVVKVARHNQDMRFDLPVIGPKTIKVLKLAKASVLAVESDKTLILNKQEVIEKSKRYKIKLFGI